jgi:hypothetical protein
MLWRRDIAGHHDELHRDERGGHAEPSLPGHLLQAVARHCGEGSGEFKDFARSGPACRAVELSVRIKLTARDLSLLFQQEQFVETGP